MPRKNRNNYNYNNRGNGNTYHSNGGGGGSGSGQNFGRYNQSSGGVHKWSSNSNRQQNSNRRIYLNPTVIESLDRDETMGTNVPHTSTASASNFNDDRKNKKNRRQVLDRLKDVAKPKLTIGDSEAEIKKQLLESKPHCKLSTMPDEVFSMIVAYVQNYFNCFDANRESLLVAYNQKVTFSFSINTSAAVAHRTFKFDDYLYKQSRNLKRINGNDDHQIEKRYKLLHQGYIDTVSFLSKLPPTEHEASSFKLDSCYFTPHMISFSLSGVFKEGKPSDKVRPLRSFQRIFICIPDPTYQMTIINEQFILTNITSDQFKKYYPDLMGRNSSSSNNINDVNRQTTNSGAVAVATASVASASVTAAVVQAPPPVQPVANAIVDPNLSIEQQNIMIQQFSTQSHLTLEWSKYCLEFSQWNYEKAAEEFIKHKDKIPKEAFLVV